MRAAAKSTHPVAAKRDEDEEDGGEFVDAPTGEEAGVNRAVCSPVAAASPETSGCPESQSRRADERVFRDSKGECPRDICEPFEGADDSVYDWVPGFDESGSPDLTGPASESVLESSDSDGATPCSQSSEAMPRVSKWHWN